MYNVTENIFKLVESDRELRLKIALNLGIVEQSVTNAVERKSDNLTKFGALKAIKEHTGLAEDKIIEQVQTATA